MQREGIIRRIAVEVQASRHMSVLRVAEREKHVPLQLLHVPGLSAGFEGAPRRHACAEWLLIA